MLTKQVDMNNIHLLPEKETKSIETAMDRFLASISLEKRVIFLRRYWFCDTYAEIASRYGISERKVIRILQNTREQLCNYLDRPWFFFGMNRINSGYVREAEEVTILNPNQLYLYQGGSMITHFCESILRQLFYIPNILNKIASLKYRTLNQ